MRIYCNEFRFNRLVQLRWFVVVLNTERKVYRVEIEIFDDEGTMVASGSLIFDQDGLWQKNLDAFGVEDPLLDGWVEISCNDPAAIWYGYATVIDQITNDSVYRPAMTRQSSIP